MPGLRQLDLVLQAQLPDTNEKLLSEIILLPGERLAMIDLPFVVGSLPYDNQGRPVWVSQHQALSYNLGCLAVRPDMLHTMARKSINGRGWPEQADDLEWVWSTLCHDQGLDGSDWWTTRAGQAISDFTSYDPAQGIFIRGNHDPDTDPEISFGPRGVSRLWSHNALLSPSVLEAANQDIRSAPTATGTWSQTVYGHSFANLAAFVTSVNAALGKLFGGAGQQPQNFATFKDTPRMRITPGLRGPAIILIGGWRDNTHGSNEWLTANLSTSSKHELLMQALTGSTKDVRHAIEVRNDADADWLRSWMFGGFLHTEGVPTDADRSWVRQLFDAITPIGSVESKRLDDTTFSNAELNIHGQGVAYISTPYLDNVEEASETPTPVDE